MKTNNSRRNKIDLLRGLVNGKKSLEDLSPYRSTPFLIKYEGNPTFYRNLETGKIISEKTRCKYYSCSISLPLSCEPGGIPLSVTGETILTPKQIAEEFNLWKYLYTYEVSEAFPPWYPPQST